MKEAKLPRTEQPQLFLEMHIAQNQLTLGQAAEAKAAVEAGKETLAGLNDVSVSEGCPETCPVTPQTSCFQPEFRCDHQAPGGHRAHDRCLAWWSGTSLQPFPTGASAFGDCCTKGLSHGSPADLLQPHKASMTSSSNALCRWTTNRQQRGALLGQPVLQGQARLCFFVGWGH